MIIPLGFCFAVSFVRILVYASTAWLDAGLHVHGHDQYHQSAYELCTSHLLTDEHFVRSFLSKLYFNVMLTCLQCVQGTS